MPVTPAQNGQSASVLAYNGDSPRGWNDPPTFAFSKSTGSRPKLDLRKRVSHQQALHGTHSPAYAPNPPSSYGVPSGEISDRMATLSMQSPPVTEGTGSPMPVRNPHTQPDIIKNPQPVPFYTPLTTATNNTATLQPANHHMQPQQQRIIHSQQPVPFYPPQTTTNTNDYHRSYSFPTMYTPPANTQTQHVDPASTPDIHNAVVQEQDVTQSTGFLGQPLFDFKNHSFEPVKTHNAGVRSTAEIGDHLDDHRAPPQIFQPVQPMLNNGAQSSTQHLGSSTPPMGTTLPGRVSPMHKGARPISPHPAIPVAPPKSQSMPVNPVLPMATPMNNVNSAPVLPPGSQFTSSAPLPDQPPSMGNGTPPPPLLGDGRTPTPPSGMLPPPGSRSTGSTPRCLSPEQDVDGTSDEEGLKTTMEALNSVIQKFKLEKRISDDINKRLQVMSKMWLEGKLGKTVKSRMIILAKALNDGNGEEAHHVHVSIIVDHVAEVNQWMVGVKRLISLVRQQAATRS